MKMPLQFFFFVLACISIHNISISQIANKKLPVSPDVKIGKLPNGFTYYIRKNQEPKNRAELRLVVNAGSILETESQRGLAHFVEHMAFNGTKNFKKQELVDFLEKSGVQFGADLNAYTSFDETVYELQLPTDSVTVFKTGFQILEDWAHNISFEPKEIDKERGVVIEEWRLGQGAQERLRTKYFPILLKGSMYANRLPIGTKKNLETFKYETLKQFYHDWYRPDLMAVVAVGDFDVDEVEQLIKQHFSKIPPTVNPKPRKRFPIPSTNQTATAVLTDPEQPYNVVQIYYKQPEIPEAQTDVEYRSMIVRELFNRMISGRLEELGQKPEAPFVFANTSYDELLGDKDAFILFGVAKDGSKVLKTTEVLLQENERIRQHGFTLTELERAKSAMLSYIETVYNERDKTKSANFVRELVQNYLTKEPIPGIEYEYELYKRYLPGIEMKEVNALVAKWIKPVDRAVLVLAPETEKNKLASQQQLLALLNKPTGKLKAYEDKTTTGGILARLPEAGKVTTQRRIDTLGVTELTLSNGVKVVLKPTNFKNNEILFSAISPGGSSLYSDEEYLSASNASTIAITGGIGNHDMNSLQKFLTGKQVSVYPSIGNYSEGISGRATPKDLQTAFELIHGYFTAPRKDSIMFQVIQQQLVTSLANKGKDPSSVFNDSVSYILSNYHPRRRPLTIDRIGEIQLDRSYNVYKERYANAGDFIFTFVGNFRVDSLVPYLEKYVASLPSTGKVESWKDLGIRYPTGVINKTIAKGQEKKTTVRLSFTGMTEYSDLESTQLDQLAKALSIRLREILREDQGGVYGVNVGANISREPINSYSITISFTAAPENADKLTGLVMDEIKNLKENGAPQTNIDKVIAEDVRAMETAVKENNYWLYNLEQKYYHKEDPTTVLQDPQIVRQLTVARTKELANKYFNMNNVAKLMLVPEK